MELEKSSRKDQLLQSSGVAKDWNIRLRYKDPRNATILIAKLKELFLRKFIIDTNRLKKSQELIKQHFDAMGEIIKCQPNIQKCLRAKLQ